MSLVAILATLLGEVEGHTFFFDLMEGYTPVWRHLPHRLMAPSVSVYGFYFVFVIFGGGGWRGLPRF